MAPSPDGNGVILVGGSKGWSDSIDSILELNIHGLNPNQGWIGSWTILTTKLQFKRMRHVVIPILMDEEFCGTNIPTTGKYIYKAHCTIL